MYEASHTHIVFDTPFFEASHTHIAGAVAVHMVRRPIGPRTVHD